MDMSDASLFFGKFLRYGTAIASVAPSSRWLSLRCVQNIDWSKAKVVVELGAGTGPITRALVAHAPTTCKIMVIEGDRDFAALLRSRFASYPHMEVVEGDACDFERILKERGIVSADYIISGLPTPSLAAPNREKLLKSIKNMLAPEGTFNQITEMPLVYQRFYKRYFKHVEFVFEPRNIPPAGVYICTEPK